MAEDEATVFVDRDCWPSVVVFMRLMNQWEVGGMDGMPRCLPIERVALYLDRCCAEWPAEQSAQTIEDILTMEDEAIIVFRKMRDAKKSEAGRGVSLDG